MGSLARADSVCGYPRNRNLYRKHIIMKDREYTNLLLERIEEGLYDKDQVIMACVKYMSEEAVQDMMHCNEMLFDEEEFAEALDDALEN
jgi:hypothetical protein